MRTMRALVKERRAPGAAIREVPVPEPGPGEVLIQVQAASVCGTDLHIYRWDEWAQGRMGTSCRACLRPRDGRPRRGARTGNRGRAARNASRRRDAPRRLDLLPVPDRPRARLRQPQDPGRGRRRRVRRVRLCPRRNAWPSEGLAPGDRRHPGADGQRRLFATFVEEITTASRWRSWAAGRSGSWPSRSAAFAGAARSSPRTSCRTGARWPRRWARTRARRAGDVVAEIRRDDRRHGRRRSAGDEWRRVGNPPGLRDDAPTAAVSRCWACHRGRSRWTSTTRSSSAASASTASRAASIWGTWYKTAALLREGLDVARSSPTACR